MEVRREVGGRELRLRYTFNSICAMEERAQEGLDRIMKRAYSAVRLLFWGALIELQPGITMAEAGDIIGAHIKAGGSIDEVALICAEALEKAGFALPEEE